MSEGWCTTGCTGNTLCLGDRFLSRTCSKLGRDLEKVMIIDNVAENYMLQPRNGLHIQSWYADPNDM